MTILYLTGPRACGKTTAGRLLARSLDAPLLDTDAMLQEDGRSVADIVAAEGWEGFRARESAILRRAAEELRASGASVGVVSTGGGMVLAEENRIFMRRTGIVIFLSAPAALLAARLERGALEAQRPSLTGQDVVAEVEQVLKERLPLYKEAQHIVDASLPAGRVCALIRRLCGLHGRDGD